MQGTNGTSALFTLPPSPGTLLFDLGAPEQRLHHSGPDRHDPGQGGLDLFVRSSGLPRTYEAALRSRLTVAGEHHCQPDQRLRLRVEGRIVAAAIVEALELVDQSFVRVLVHRRLLLGWRVCRTPSYARPPRCAASWWLMGPIHGRSRGRPAAPHGCDASSGRLVPVMLEGAQDDRGLGSLRRRGSGGCGSDGSPRMTARTNRSETQ